MSQWLKKENPNMCCVTHLQVSALKTGIDLVTKRTEEEKKQRKENKKNTMVEVSANTYLFDPVTVLVSLFMFVQYICS